jgi:hypothetical protein
MTRNDIGFWWRDIEVRSAASGNEFDRFDDLGPWIALTGTAMRTAYDFDTVVSLLSGLGFSAKTVATAEETLERYPKRYRAVDEIVDILHSRHHGYVSNCKSWNVVGGTHVRWCDDGTELIRDVASERSVPYRLEGGSDYDCGTPGERFTVGYPRVPRPRAARNPNE